MNCARQKILTVRIVNRGGGAESSVGNFLRFARKDGYEVLDLCLSDFKTKDGIVGKLRATVKFVLKIRNELSKATSLIACVEGAPFLMAYIAALGINKPKVMWLHCEPTEYLKYVTTRQKLYIRLSLFIAKNIICASPWYAKVLSKKANKKSIFLPNFIENTDFSKSIQSENYLHRTKFLYVGSLSVLKNVSACFGVLNRISKSKEVNFTIYGDGPERLRLVDESELVSSSLKVAFKGYAQIDWSSYRSDYILLVPSKTEALPMVIVEAIAHGIPVVTSKYKGHEFFSSHEGLVFAADFDCPELVEEAIEKIASLTKEEYCLRFINSTSFLKIEFDNYKNLNALTIFMSTL